MRPRPRQGSPPAEKPIGAVPVPDDPGFFAIADMTRLSAYVVEGNCMESAGINNGDVVFVDPREARHRDVVVALVDGRSMLKRYLVENGVVCLRPDDRSSADIIPQQELVIYGVVVGLMRHFRSIPTSE
jgi:repressor LexA